MRDVIDQAGIAGLCLIKSLGAFAVVALIELARSHRCRLPANALAWLTLLPLAAVVNNLIHILGIVF